MSPIKPEENDSFATAAEIPRFRIPERDVHFASATKMQGKFHSPLSNQNIMSNELQSPPKHFKLIYIPYYARCVDRRSEGSPYGPPVACIDRQHRADQFWRRARLGLGGIGRRSDIVGIAWLYSLPLRRHPHLATEPRHHVEIMLGSLGMYKTPRAPGRIRVTDSVISRFGRLYHVGNALGECVA